MMNICHHMGKTLYFLSLNSSEHQAVDMKGTGEIFTPRNYTGPWLSIDTRGAHFQPEVLLSSIEDYANQHDLSINFGNHPVFMLRKHACGNAGHCILENMFAIALDYMAWIPRSRNPFQSQILLMETVQGKDCGCTGHRMACGSGANESPAMCNKFVADTLAMMSDLSVLFINELPSYNSTLKTLDCWSEAYAGHGQKSPYTEGGGVFNFAPGYLRLFRDLVYERVGYTPRSVQASVASLDNGVIRVLAAKKHGRRIIANFDTVVAWIRECVVQFGNTNYSFHVDVIDWATTPNISMHVALLSQTHIYLTSPGSASMQALFLPDYSAMITTVFCSFGTVPCDDFEHRLVHTHAPHYATHVYSVMGLDEARKGAHGPMLDVVFNAEKLKALLTRATVGMLSEVYAAAQLVHD